MKSARFHLSLPSSSGFGLARAAVVGLSFLVLAGAASAGVQWKWRDANGAIQYSDRPPPPGTPEQAILARPSGYKPPAARAPVEAASAPASNAAPNVDPALEAKRKKAEDETKARKKADDEKLAAQKADNCNRARSYMRTLQDGMRITRTKANGEREVLDDQGRAEEMQRTQDAIGSNCE